MDTDGRTISVNEKRKFLVISYKRVGWRVASFVKKFQHKRVSKIAMLGFVKKLYFYILILE